MERKSGVLMHISSLPSDYSIGNFGDGAKKFIDFLAECGFSYWQVLPFCVTGDCNSPYCSYSSFSLNPYFTDPEKLYEKGLVTLEELNEQKQDSPYVCEYEKLFEKRLIFLKKASKHAKNKSEIEDFCQKHPHTKNFCEFMGKKYAANNKSWIEFDENLYNEETVFMWKFIQFEFYFQWIEIKKYANEKGVKIIGDIPFYVSFESSDVASNPQYFLLDKDNIPTCVAGVPPDYFSADGQLWGNPLYNWNEMKKDDYKWQKERLEFYFELFDGVRLDHFRGFESYWSVKNGEKTAKNGHWEKGPGLELINIFKKIKKDKLIIAEDLGEITDDVRNLVKESGFPGMNVFQFGFFGDAKSNHIPHNYKKNSVSYSGTHDNNTLLGFLWELNDNDRKNMLSYCGYENEDWEKGYNNMLKTIFMSHSDIVIFPIQDLLGYGSDTRLNTPGTAKGNWQFRITYEQLNSIDKEKFKNYNRIYGRI